jgi:hypothetical protein
MLIKRFITKRIGGILFILFSLSLQAQVTIGDVKPPYDISVLEMIAYDPNRPSDTPKGLRLPLLAKPGVAALKAKIEAIQRKGEEPTGSNTIQSDWIEKQACGLLVFNTEEQCMEIWNGEEQKFDKLWGKAGRNAAIDLTGPSTLNCSTDIRIYPSEDAAPDTPTDYKQGEALDGMSYIRLAVFVTETGRYTVTAKPANANGYSFSATGQWLETGKHYLILKGEGTPVNGGQTDTIELFFNGKSIGCPMGIPIAL